MLEDWIYFLLPRIFCGLAFTVNPIFVYLVFTEKQAKFGNYRFLLLFFAIFNLIYSVLSVIVPIDIHSYRYCYFLITRNGWFVQRSTFNFHMMSARCSLVGASYAILLIHFIYRYLAIHNSDLTRNKFHWYMLFSIFTCVLYFGAWQALHICYFLEKANMEIREYIRQDFRLIYGNDSMNFNIIGALFNEGSDETRIKAFSSVLLSTSVSAVSIIMFLVLAITIVTQLKKMTRNASKKTSKFQFELLRALFVQTVIPIVISFSPCLLIWYSPVFGIQLPRGFNHFEISALGLFAFVDPVAITLSLPIFRKRMFSFCRQSTNAGKSSLHRGTQ
ncbi:hypothetical protein B9Z55_017898 [Caenorhabditis nigoni]|uniref:Serpentine Receptor, class J n=1 Tax=Caenorhabditis nigoni TaxID=1611254 RepID=A0A2G5TBJ8_9PELO|nr:hypothetical protein B9Z55_017898 [Caenorhabditis nigoni]